MSLHQFYYLLFNSDIHITFLVYTDFFLCVYWLISFIICALYKFLFANSFTGFFVVWIVRFIFLMLLWVLCVCVFLNQYLLFPFPTTFPSSFNQKSVAYSLYFSSFFSLILTREHFSLNFCLLINSFTPPYCLCFLFHFNLWTKLFRFWHTFFKSFTFPFFQYHPRFYKFILSILAF